MEWHRVAGRVALVPAVLATLALAGCGLLPTPEQPAARIPVGAWVAFARQPATTEEAELGGYLAARQAALAALATHQDIVLSEPTDAELVPELLWIEDVGGRRVYQAPGGTEPPGAWVIAFHAPPLTDDAEAVEALVVVGAETREVLLLHAEGTGGTP